MTAFMWMMTTIFSKEYLAHARNRNRYLLLPAGKYRATMCVFLSDDLFTTFVFFEIMSLASYVCVIHDEKKETMYAGAVYLAVAVIGGMATLMVTDAVSCGGTLQLDALLSVCEEIFQENARWLYIAGSCILLIWRLSGMYPASYMAADGSSCSTGSGQCAVIGYYHKDGYFRCDCYFLTYLFAQRILGNGHSAVWCDHDDAGRYSAVFSLDLKWTLACSSMSQLGFIFVGIGMQGLLGEENALAVRGTMLHMFNHSNLKLVLFMAVVVVMNLHKLNLNDIRGFGRKKPLLYRYIPDGFSGIGGIPLFNGYVSKTLIHESIVEYIELLKEGHGAATFAFASGEAVALFKVIEWLFIIAGAMTVAYMTKLFIVLL